MNIRPGDDVMVHIPLEDRTHNEELMKYQGVVMPVTRRVSGFRRTKYYFELEGAVSDKGIPYAFIMDWLVKMDEDDDEQ